MPGIQADSSCPARIVRGKFCLAKVKELESRFDRSRAAANDAARYRLDAPADAGTARRCGGARRPRFGRRRGIIAAAAGRAARGGAAPTALGCGSGRLTSIVTFIFG